MNQLQILNSVRLSFSNDKIKFLVDRMLIIIVLIEVIVIFMLLVKILNFHYQTSIFGKIIMYQG
jgi:hypothetical protein